MLIPLVAVGALVGAYLWDKKRKETALAQTLAAPPAPGMAAPHDTGIQYPQAVSQSDPNKISKGYVIRYQAAQPMPTGKYYQPADGDVSAIVQVRLSGIPVGVKPSTYPGGVTMTYADLGKLNGFLTPSDLIKWIDAKKPLHLPAGFKDGGARQGANGTITG